MDSIVAHDEVLHRRYLILSTVLTEIEAEHLTWHDFWPRFAEFCGLLGEYTNRRFATGALKDLRKVERAAEAEQPEAALQHRLQGRFCQQLRVTILGKGLGDSRALFVSRLAPRVPP